MSGNPESTTGIDVEEAARTMINDLGLTEEAAEKSVAMLGALSEGASLGDLHGIEPRKLEMVYSVAKTFYSNQKYDDALNMFRFLTLMDNTNQKYWLGLASTYQMQKNYQKATEAYGYATILDIENPKPQLQAGYCLIQMEMYEEATSALEGVLMIDDLDAKSKLQATALLSQVERAASSNA